MAGWNCRLQRGEIRLPGFVEYHRFAIHDAVGKRLRGSDYAGEALRPIVPLAGADGWAVLLDANLHTVAIELDLVQPLLAAWGTAHQQWMLRQDEVGNRRPARRHSAFFPD